MRLSYRVKKVREKKSVMLTGPLQISVEFTEFSAQSASTESNRASELALKSPLDREKIKYVQEICTRSCASESML